jgi:hypothetical protein
MTLREGVHMKTLATERQPRGAERGSEARRPSALGQATHRGANLRAVLHRAEAGLVVLRLKSFIQYSFILVVAIAFLMIFEQFVFQYVTTLPPTITSAEYGVYALQAVAVISTFCVGMVLVPSLTNSVFSGSSGESLLHHIRIGRFMTVRGTPCPNPTQQIRAVSRRTARQGLWSDSRGLRDRSRNIPELGRAEDATRHAAR